jgi:sulfide:quinone oxidoreductase
MDMEHHGILIIGGGNAGISLAARLLRDGAPDVSVVEASDVHRYRPLLNYVGVGEAAMDELERPMADVMPAGCTWIDDEVVAVDAAASVVRTRGGRTLHYSTLVVCPGMSEDWDATPGLRQAYAAGWAGSTFVPASVPRLWPALRDARGTVVFTVPPEPSPCGATALKPLFMACDHWRGVGVMSQMQVVLVLPRQDVTGLRSADDRLEACFESSRIDVLREARVDRIDAEQRSVVVSDGDAARSFRDVAFAHVVPAYRAPAWVADSGLADGSWARLIDIDPETLRHRRHPRIWSIGDAAAVATPPSGGALRKQVDVLAHNIRVAVTRAGELRRYDGYTVMPVTVSRQRLVLAEVDRENRPAPSVPVLDLTRPRRTTWWFDRYGLPATYFRRILRGKV